MCGVGFETTRTVNHSVSRPAMGTVPLPVLLTDISHFVREDTGRRIFNLINILFVLNRDSFLYLGLRLRLGFRTLSFHLQAKGLT